MNVKNKRIRGLPDRSFYCRKKLHSLKPEDASTHKSANTLHASTVFVIRDLAL